MPHRLLGDPTLAQIVLGSSLDGLAVMDREGRYILWNRAMERFARKTADEVLGRPALEVFPFLRDVGLDVAFDRALAGEAVTIDGVAHVESDGTRKVYDRLYVPLRSNGVDVDGVIAIVRDATARHAVLDALKQSEASLRMAVEAGEVGLWSWDPAADVIVWEDAMCDIFLLPAERAPRTRGEYLALVHPDDRPNAAGRVAGGEETGRWSDEYRIVRGDGAIRWVMSKARFLQVEGRQVVLGALFDVTDRREREDRHRAAQKLETIGQLTAGIAHNFNNMLMGLLPNLQLASRRAPGDLVPLLQAAERSAQSAADVVRQLMTYAGTSSGVTRRAEPLGELVSQTVAFVRATFGPHVELTVSTLGDPTALVDASQIEQVVLNLIINARDALSGASTSSPRITVEVTTVGDGAPELAGRSGAWACLRVGDNGVGMTPDVLQRVYEPFFTTKEVGKGTGLGLSTTHAIVRDHSGFITCRSERGAGTAFSVYLPATGGREATTKEDTSRARTVRRSANGAGVTVLVVDDDGPIRKVVSLVLEDAGFLVECAASGEEALQIVRATPIALVLLDVSMPGMPGPVLRKKLRELAPELPVVYLTGHNFKGDEGDAVLQKPLTTQELVAGVETALQRRAAPKGSTSAKE